MIWFAQSFENCLPEKRGYFAVYLVNAQDGTLITIGHRSKHLPN